MFSLSSLSSIPCGEFLELRSWRTVIDLGVLGSWTCVLDFEGCQVYEEHLQILSLEKVSMFFFKHLNKMAANSQSAQDPSRHRVWRGFALSLLYPQLYHLPFILLMQMRLHCSVFHHLFIQKASSKQNPWEATGSNFHCLNEASILFTLKSLAKVPVVRSGFLPP